MKNRFQAHFRRFVAAIVQQLGPIITPEYTITCEFDVNFEDNDTPRETKMAEACISMAYLEAHIRLSKDLKRVFRNGQYDMVADTIIHELAHVITNHLYEAALKLLPEDRIAPDALVDAYEQTTQRIANVTLRLLGEGWPARLASHTRRVK